MTTHVFELNGEWSGGINGTGQITTSSLQSIISTPENLGGKNIGTNPEDLILAASASCYMITIAAILQYKKIAFKKINLKSKATFEMGNAGPSIKKIEHYPEVILPSHAELASREKIQECLLTAKQNCMISAAMRNNVEITVNSSLVEV